MVTRISLALQGGGAHGAYSWGVLDRLLEEPGLEIAAISGTSAGALNGAVLKAGLVSGGPEAARRQLRKLWQDIAAIGDFRTLGPWFQSFLPAIRFWQEATAAVLPFSPQAIAAQFYSPYDWGEAWENPLAPVLEDLDFDHIRSAKGPALFIGATNLRTGKVHIFKGNDIGPEAILASTCLPSVFKAVEIDGEAYWDGGFSGNPSLWPLYEAGLPDDILLVQVNPLRRDAIPQTPLDIQNRVNEIGFNTALLSELRAVAFVKRLIAEGRIRPDQMKDVRIHLIADDVLMNRLSASSKLQPTGPLIEELFLAGRVAASAFLTGCNGQIGPESAFELNQLFG